MKIKACCEIESKVIKNNLCTFCGACLEMCPYLLSYEGRIFLRDICNLLDGHCSTVCPRLSFDPYNINKSIFGTPYSWDGLGTVKKVLIARSNITHIRARAQNAGTVTALITFALDQQFIDSAILTRFNDKKMPEGFIASTKDEILQCSGSNYMAAPTIGMFNRASQDQNRNSIAVVGTPCQVMALRKMNTSPKDVCKNIDKLKLVIGLFCTWALSYPDFARFIEKEISDKIVKYDIPPHPANALIAYTENQSINIPIDKILPFVRPACRLCTDLTAEFADISIGSGRGAVLDWNTVIIRSEIGQKFIESAMEKGIIETRDMPEGNLGRLKAAAETKWKRALSNIIKKTGNQNNLLYLKAQTGIIEKLMKE